MILIDAIYINQGGGKVLLDFLVQELEKTNLNIFYLLDNRIKNKRYHIKEENQVFYIESSFFNRFNFYKKNRKKFSKILAFGNVPPFVKTQAEVYTYMHNTNYIFVPKDYSIKEKILFWIKGEIARLTSKNTDFWLVQTEVTRQQFIDKFSQNEKIKVLPFYPKLEIKKSFSREENTFFYPSNITPNKNHFRLINAFCNVYDKYRKGRLILTINQNYNPMPLISDLVEEKQKQGYPIENIGFVDREKLTEMYLKTEYIIFPSLAESFGLGLVEGIDLGCKIVGADLPYTYAVCEPSITFDPLSEKSIENGIIKALLKENLKESYPKVNNQIENLINLLKE